MKLTVVKDCVYLDAWAKNPRGYAVLMETHTANIRHVHTGKRIGLVRVSDRSDHAFRQLEKIREVFDIDPNGFAPRVVIVPWDIAQEPRNEQFMRRAKVNVGV